MKHSTSTQIVFVASVGTILIIIIVLIIFILYFRCNKQKYKALYEEVQRNHENELSRHEVDLCFLLANEDGIHAYDKTMFSEHNVAIIPYADEFITVSRIENSRFLKATQQPGINIGSLHTIPYFQRNYVSIRVGFNESIIFKGPILNGMHPQIPWYQQYEDPRIYFEPVKQRLFMTATIFTLNTFRITLLELEPVTLECINGYVLNMEGDIPQKNWNLFLDRDNKTRMITDAYPQWIVRDINLDTGKHQVCSKQNVPLFETLGKFFHIRCSSGMIVWSETTLLTALHIRTKLNTHATYRTIFVELMNHAPFTPVRVSRVFTFVKDKYRVEFVSSLCWNKTCTKLKLGLGVDDSHNRIVDIEPSIIFKSKNTKYDSNLNDSMK